MNKELKQKLIKHNKEMRAAFPNLYDQRWVEKSADEAGADKWYKSKLHFITIDEKTEKEKKTAVYYLVQGSSLENARKNIDEVMGGTMIDYVISGVNETKIEEVFEHTAKKQVITI